MINKIKNTNQINTENLEENDSSLELNGETIATQTISWGWTKFYATPAGDGFGTIRNTGFAYYVNERAFKAEVEMQCN